MFEINDKVIGDLLDKAPDSNDAVNELFEKAKDKSENQYNLAILDLSVPAFINEEHRQKHPLAFDNTTGWIMREFSIFMDFIAPDKIGAEFTDANSKLFTQRLHMLAYTQFWECLKIQRLLYQLINIATGRDYDPAMLIARQEDTANVYEGMIKASKRGLKINEVLKALYNCRIRNAFAHSNFANAADKILFFCPKKYKKGEKKGIEDPLVKIKAISKETWDRLFSDTVRFMKELFKRYHMESEILKEKRILMVQVPGQKGQYKALWANNKWVFDHETLK